MSHLSRRTTIVTAIAAAAALATGTGIAAAGQPTKPAAPPASTNNLGAYTVVSTPLATIAAGAYSFFAATCPAGLSVLGGGGSNSSGAGVVILTDSRPNGSTGWGVWYKNTGSTDSAASAWAVCGS
jgi:hypothetical protein